MLNLVVILAIGTAGTVFAHGNSGGTASNCSGDYVDEVFFLNYNFSLYEDGDEIVSGSRDYDKTKLDWNAGDGYAVTCAKVAGYLDGEYKTYEYDRGAVTGSGLEAPQYAY